MATLTRHPAQHPRSTGELLHLAATLDERAAARYRVLARTMRERGERDLARVFALLADVEERHRTRPATGGRAEVPGIDAPPPAETGLPEPFDEETAASATLTPYRALALAVRFEESCFAYYSYIASEAKSAEVRTLAESLAKEKLDQAALLRRRRRREFRREGRAKPREPLPRTLAELRALAAREARAAASLHRALAESLAAEGQERVADAFLAVAREEEREAWKGPAPTGRPEPPEAPPTVTAGLRVLEAAFERYSEIAERAADEALLAEAQRLAEAVLRRLASTRATIAAAKASD
ncbi:MAG: hypothetical protein IRZ04_02950 [Rhodospirillales bacterium]|nr:hypothetical protein [Rhodospirillales bacterium]